MAAGEPLTFYPELRITLRECLAETSEASSAALHDLFAGNAAGDGGCSVRECTGSIAAPGPCFRAEGLPECNACLEVKCAAEYAACLAN